MPRALLLSVSLLALLSCSASSTESPSPSASESASATTAPTDTADMAMADASASPGASGSPGASASPTPFRTPTPRLGNVPGIPVGRAANVIGEVPSSGMIRVSGLVLKAPKVAAPGICVTLGPPIACAVLTDSAGKWIIDVPQGSISWEFHFIRGVVEVGPMVKINGPFQGNTVAVDSVTVR